MATVVMGMQSVPTLMGAILVPVYLDTPEMEKVVQVSANMVEMI